MLDNGNQLTEPLVEQAQKSKEQTLSAEAPTGRICLLFENSIRSNHVDTYPLDYWPWNSQ